MLYNSTLNWWIIVENDFPTIGIGTFISSSCHYFTLVVYSV